MKPVKNLTHFKKLQLFCEPSAIKKQPEEEEHFTSCFFMDQKQDSVEVEVVEGFCISVIFHVMKRDEVD